MDRYYGTGASETRSLIDQMSMEMEKKAKECESLRSELSKKEAALRRAEKDNAVLRQEHYAAMRDLADAREEKAKIASILGLDGLEADAAQPSPKHASSFDFLQPVTPSTSGYDDADTRLSEYASTALERMRNLNRTLPMI